MLARRGWVGLPPGRAMQAMHPNGSTRSGMRAGGARSPYPAPLRLDEAEAIAGFFRTRRALGIEGGMLVANPVPEADEIPAEEMAGFISAAQEAAKADGVSGKAVTPYLLAKILEVSGGRSLATNIALVENNSRLAARIARTI